MTPAERYIRLGLRLGRHVEGVVDAYYGPPELAAAVDAEPLVDPATLAADAEGLLDELGDGWLRDQIRGLRTYAAALAGDALSYADEVEGCFGMRPDWTDESDFAAAHEQLDELLPGEGDLAARYQRWEESIRIPTELVERTMAAVIAEARRWTRELVDLPAAEGVELEVVHDKSWWAFCEYLGDFRSRIQVNVDLPMSAMDMLVLAMHETYPGHHADRACKELLFVRERGMLEETIVLIPTPQCMVMEGVAMVAPEVVLESEASAAVAAALRTGGVELDLEHALAVRRAKQPCGWAEVNAALMLHDRGVTEDETRTYLGRWALESPQWCEHLVRFLTDRTSRTYVLTYHAGRELCEAYVGGEPERLRRLLTEQVRVGELSTFARG